MHYYEALEAQALWEGAIQMTALVALLDGGARGASTKSDDFISIASQAAAASLDIDMSGQALWRAGGIIVTEHMLYVIVFDDDADWDTGGSASPLRGRSVEVSDINGASSPQGDPFDAALRHLPPFSLVIEDVLPSVVELALFEGPTNGNDASHGSLDRQLPPPPRVLRLQTLAQEVWFVLKDEHSFDNTSMDDFVHAFGVLPGVKILQRAPLLDEASFHSASWTMMQEQGTPLPTTSRADANDSGFRIQTADASHGMTDSSALVDVMMNEVHQRSAIWTEASTVLSDITGAAFRDACANLTEVATQLASRDSIRVRSVDGLEPGDHPRLRSLLEAHEREARLRHRVFLTTSQAVASEGVLRAERQVMRMEANALAELSQRDLKAATRELRDRDQVISRLESQLRDLVVERDTLRDREQAVVDSARLRESALHAQLKELRGASSESRR